MVSILSAVERRNCEKSLALEGKDRPLKKVDPKKLREINTGFCQTAANKALKRKVRFYWSFEEISTFSIQFMSI